MVAASLARGDGYRFWFIAAAALTERPAACAPLDATELDAFADWAARQGVSALLFRASPEWTAPAALHERLRDAARSQIAVAAAEEHELRRVLLACAAAGISPILLKGAALAHIIYPDPALRPRADTDAIVLPQDERAMRATLEQLGYSEVLAASGRFVTAQFHYALERPGIRHIWDVHLKISNAHAYASRLTYSDLRSEAVSIAALDGALAPSIVHSLIVASIHRVAHHGEDDDFLWLFDIHLLGGALRCGGSERLLEVARSTQCSGVLLRGIARAAELFGPSLRDDVVEQLENAAAREPPPPLVDGRSRPIDVFLNDVSTLHDWPSRVRLVREHLFPPPAYMRRLYPRWHPVLLPAAYVHRIVHGSSKWFHRRRTDTDA